MLDICVRIRRKSQSRMRAGRPVDTTNRLPSGLKPNQVTRSELVTSRVARTGPDGGTNSCTSEPTETAIRLPSAVHAIRFVKAPGRGICQTGSHEPTSQHCNSVGELVIS